MFKTRLRKVLFGMLCIAITVPLSGYAAPGCGSYGQFDQGAGNSDLMAAVQDGSDFNPDCAADAVTLDGSDPVVDHDAQKTIGTMYFHVSSACRAAWSTLEDITETTPETTVAVVAQGPDGQKVFKTRSSANPGEVIYSPMVLYRGYKCVFGVAHVIAVDQRPSATTICLSPKN